MRIDAPVNAGRLRARRKRTRNLPLALIRTMAGTLPPPDTRTVPVTTPPATLREPATDPHAGHVLVAREREPGGVGC